MNVERIFTNGMHASPQGEAAIRRSAARRYQACEVGWVRSSHRGPTGKPYMQRQLAVILGGAVVAVARVNRRWAVSWHEPWSNEHFEIEEPKPCPLS